MLQEFLNKIYTYQYISFDIFDTLLKRSVVCPDDIFELVELIYNKRNANKIYNFKKKRILAEKEARKKSTKEDVSLENIYGQIDYAQEIKKQLIELECYVEISSCYPNADIIEMFNKCLEKNKFVILISDMYLPENVITDMLKKVRVYNYEKLYISSNFGLTKRSGNLFKYVLEDLNIEGKELLHIGDDKDTDYIPAVKFGISSFLIKNTKTVNNYWKNAKRNIEVKHLLSCISGLNYKGKSPQYLLGSQLIGPVLYQFCMWLHEEDQINKFSKIAFMAREGYLLYCTYQEMYPEDQGKLCYIRLNRNTLRMPLLDNDCSVDNFISLIGSSTEYNIYQICDMLLLDIKTEKCKYLLNKYGYFPETKIAVNTMKKDKKFILFYEECIDISRKEIRKQRIALNNYIEQKNLNGKVALVNNSMHASAQSYLAELFPEKDFWGIYFILTQKGERKIKSKCSTWFKRDCKQFDKKLFCRNSLVFEHLLFEHSGTAKFFRQQEDKVLVICEPYDEESSNDVIIDEVKNGTMDFVKFFQNTLPIKIKRKENLVALSQFLRYPQKSDAIVIGKLVDCDYEGKRQLASKVYAKEEPIYRIFKCKVVPWKQGMLSISDKLFLLKLYDIYLHITMAERFI